MASSRYSLRAKRKTRYFEKVRKPCPSENTKITIDDDIMLRAKRKNRYFKSVRKPCPPKNTKSNIDDDIMVFLQQSLSRAHKQETADQIILNLNWTNFRSSVKVPISLPKLCRHCNWQTANSRLQQFYDNSTFICQKCNRSVLCVNKHVTQYYLPAGSGFKMAACVLCGLSVPWADLHRLLTHLRLSHSVLLRKCCQCDFLTSSEMGMADHLAPAHGGYCSCRSCFRCGQCRVFVLSAAKLFDHYQDQHGHTLVQCPRCAYMAESTHHLDRHACHRQYAFKPTEVGQFDLLTVRRLNAQGHTAFGCHHCTACLDTLDDYTRHRTPGGVVACFLCPSQMAFNHPCNLEKHLVSHHDFRSLRTNLELVIFAGKPAPVSFKRVAGGGDTALETCIVRCAKCHLQFPSTFDLIRHRSLEAAWMWKWQCQLCSFTGRSECQFEVHRLEKGHFPCPFCSQCFVSSLELETHVFSSHSVEAAEMHDLNMNEVGLPLDPQLDQGSPACGRCHQSFYNVSRLESHCGSAHAADPCYAVPGAGNREKPRAEKRGAEEASSHLCDQCGNLCPGDREGHCSTGSYPPGCCPPAGQHWAEPGHAGEHLGSVKVGRRRVSTNLGKTKPTRPALLHGHTGGNAENSCAKRAVRNPESDSCHVMARVTHPTAPVKEAPPSAVLVENSTTAEVPLVDGAGSNAAQENRSESAGARNNRNRTDSNPGIVPLLAGEPVRQSQAFSASDPNRLSYPVPAEEVCAPNKSVQLMFSCAGGHSFPLSSQLGQDIRGFYGHHENGGFQLAVEEALLKNALTDLARAREASIVDGDHGRLAPRTATTSGKRGPALDYRLETLNVEELGDKPVSKEGRTPADGVGGGKVHTLETSNAGGSGDAPVSREARMAAKDRRGQAPDYRQETLNAAGGGGGDKFDVWREARTAANGRPDPALAYSLETLNAARDLLVLKEVRISAEAEKRDDEGSASAPLEGGGAMGTASDRPKDVASVQGPAEPADQEPPSLPGSAYEVVKRLQSAVASGAIRLDLSGAIAAHCQAICDPALTVSDKLPHVMAVNHMLSDQCGRPSRAPPPELTSKATVVDQVYPEKNSRAAAVRAVAGGGGSLRTSQRKRKVELDILAESTSGGGKRQNTAEKLHHHDQLLSCRDSIRKRKCGQWTTNAAESKGCNHNCLPQKSRRKEKSLVDVNDVVEVVPSKTQQQKTVTRNTRSTAKKAPSQPKISI